MTPFRIILGFVLPLILLPGCTATTGTGGKTASGAPVAADGGLGVTATGGLLTADATGRAQAGDKYSLSGRLLEGPYLILLSGNDVERAQRAALTAFEETPSGQTSIWRNPANGHWGTLTPTRTFQDANGRYCRDYRQTVTTGGQEHQGNGSACLEPGEPVWRIMS